MVSQKMNLYQSDVLSPLRLKLGQSIAASHHKETRNIAKNMPQLLMMLP